MICKLWQVVLFEPVSKAIEWLSSYGDARMTGSGACVFWRVFQVQAKPRRRLPRVPPQWRAWKALALARHPCKALLQINFIAALQ